MKKNNNPQLEYTNEVINKKKLQNLMYLTFHNYGVIKSALIADKVKNLTFHYATKSGISLSIEDLRVPFKKRELIGITNNEVQLTEQNYRSGNITVVERFQKVIDIWNNANNSLKDEVLTYFRESDPLNPLYIMAFSGARGNISQVRQLVGMRGLMADPQGQIIDLPIKSNFREGLKVTEYIISSYGARKGLVDTALRTADSGYLTRRLVDVAQDIIVREEDCLTNNGLSLFDLFKQYPTTLTLKDRVVGRLLAKPLKLPNGEILDKNTEITNQLVDLIENLKIPFEDIEVRSPLTCNSLRSVCRKCYGWHLSYSRIVDLGEAVGILAAQSIGEPGTQLTMRTFHTGGVFSGDLTKQIRAPFAGTITYQIDSVTNIVRTIHGGKRISTSEKTEIAVGKYNTYILFVRYTGYPGLVNLDEFDKTGEIKIMNSSMLIKNVSVDEKAETLSLKTKNYKKDFHLLVQRNALLKHGQTFAVLKDNSYKTKTGGTIFYALDNNLGKKRRTTKKVFTGSLYWLPEETHQLASSELQTIKVPNETFVEKGTVISSNITAKTSGLFQFNLKNVPKTKIEKTRRFIKPGEFLFSKILIQKLSFLEFLTINGLDYVLIRPIQIYKVPQEKGFFTDQRYFSTSGTKNITFKTIKRIFYKDGECVKTADGVHLLQTFLALSIDSSYQTLQPRLEYLPHGEETNAYKLKIALYEIIKTAETGQNITKETKSIIHLLAKNNEYILPKSTLGFLKTLTRFGGTLSVVNKTNGTEKYCAYNPANEDPLVNRGDLVRVGTFLTKTVRSNYAGQIYNICEGQIIIRLGRPYLISEGTILRVESGSLVERSDLLATLVYDKLKTVDIVQGLPKVEEILEARKIKNGCILAPHEGKAFVRDGKIEILKPLGGIVSSDLPTNPKVNFKSGESVEFLQQLTDGPINPHDKLKTLFSYYEAKLPTTEACKESFKQLQLFLVNEVQRTYLSQGVQIADKHIEIIVKQMTSKVQVIVGGDTTLLPGEILEINNAEMITNAAIAANEEPPLYQPILLGLTKASLTSESFISAASFQETTRVLTEAAIEGKKDWLNGLKENVIIGRLIPAGTGFNYCGSGQKGSQKTPDHFFSNPIQKEQIISTVLRARLQK
uniref:DNA-directed RNA polymerase n=1 Tax=uncultured prymnesiophyte C19847 TaxID=858394 RepID=D9MYH7_9EUKA|nr:RNA polymerase beta'' subunit [uncultured prymnesiophyte C19847]